MSGDWRLMADINSRPTSGQLPGLAHGGDDAAGRDGRYFFEARNDVVGQEIFTSDGTAAGTGVLLDQTPGPDGTAIGSFWHWNGLAVLLRSDSVELLDASGGLVAAIPIAESDASGSIARGIGLLGSNLVVEASTTTSLMPDPTYRVWAIDLTELDATLVERESRINAGTTRAYGIREDHLYFGRLAEGGDTTIYRADPVARRIDEVTTFASGEVHVFLDPSKTPESIVMVARDATTTQVWTTDGTPQGTTLAADLTGSFPNVHHVTFTVAGRKLFAATTDYGTEGGQIWNNLYVRDLTLPPSAGGFVELVSLDVNDNVDDESRWRGVDSIGGRMIGRFNRRDRGWEWFVSDGTAEGTGPMDQIDGVSLPTAPSEAVMIGSDAIFFVGHDEQHGRELWRTDGTGAGTTLVVDANPGPRDSWPRRLIAAEDRLFYQATADGVWESLWSVDAAGVQPEVLLSLAYESEGSTPRDLIPAGDHLHFIANLHWGDLHYRYDAELQGDLRGRPITSRQYDPHLPRAVAVGDDLYYTARTSQTGRELWVWKGDADQPRLVRDFTPGGSDSLTVFAGGHDDRFLFGVTSSGGIRDAWSTDGTDDGTFLLIPESPFDSDETLVRFVGTDYGVLFETYESDVARLYRTPSHAFEPILLHEGIAGILQFREFAISGDDLYFAAPIDSAWNTQIFKTGGSIETTVQVSHLPYLEYEGPPYNLTTAGDRLFFTSSDRDGNELWTSDGTVSGTVQVRDVNAVEPDYAQYTDTEGSYPADLRASDSLLFFTADDGEHGREWWVSDGSEAGTHLLVDLTPGAEGSFGKIQNPVITPGGFLLFGFGQDSEAIDLYVSNGTPEGTRVVATGTESVGEWALVGEEVFANVDFDDAASELGKLTGKFDSRLSLGVGSLSVDLPASDPTVDSSMVYVGGEYRWVLDGTAVAGPGALSPTAGLQKFHWTGAGDSNRVVDVALTESPLVGGSTETTVMFDSQAEGSFRFSNSATVDPGLEIVVDVDPMTDRLQITAGPTAMPHRWLVYGAEQIDIQSEGVVKLEGVPTIQDNWALQASAGVLLPPQLRLGGGRLNVGSDLSLDADQSIIGTGDVRIGGTLQLDPGSRLLGDSQAPLRIQADSVRGGGTFDEVVVDGTYEVFANRPIHGSVEYAAGSVLHIDLSTSIGGLSHQGQVELGGVLRVTSLSSDADFVPVEGDRFEVISTSQAIVGNFTDADLPEPPSGTDWHLAYGPTSVHLELVRLPTITDAEFGDGVQRSVVDSILVTWNNQVELGPGAVRLTSIQTGVEQVVPITWESIDGSHSGTTIRIRPAGPDTRDGGAFADGRYRLVIAADRVYRDGTEITMDGDGDGVRGGDYSIGDSIDDGFFTLFGDVNGDGRVFFDDFLKFSTAYNTASEDDGFLPEVDYDGNGRINFADFLALATRYGRSISSD